jgi:hypothetical protein
MRVSRWQLREMNRGRCMPATRKQLRYLRDLSRRTEVEMPKVVWTSEASDAIRRLEQHLQNLRQPTLEGFE